MNHIELTNKATETLTATDIQKRMDLVNQMKIPPIANPFGPMLNAFVDALTDQIIKDEICTKEDIEKSTK